MPDVPRRPTKPARPGPPQQFVHSETNRMSSLMAALGTIPSMLKNAGIGGRVARQQMSGGYRVKSHRKVRDRGGLSVHEKRTRRRIRNLNRGRGPV